MRTDRDLRRQLEELDHRSYPAYRDLARAYDFGDFELSVDHVQGDPFAAPSKLSVFVPHEVARFPREYWDVAHRRRALEDYLLRRFSRALAKASFVARGSGKSGLLGTTRPGPEVLSRTACEITPDGVILRFEAGFPANGRTTNAGELGRMLLDLVPRCVRSSVPASSCPAGEALAAVRLADDQRFVRDELARRGLVSFVADGAVLPRASGVSRRPMRGALPFASPASLRVTLDLPHRGPTLGMGVPRGVTLVVGGGYHGKSTLLRALQEGVYDHVAGDGRELVITEDTACKLRAEDGRSVRDVDVSSFIDDLPSGADTRHFSTEDASGSTSQAAGLVEAVEAGCRTLLIDEDTSATNFMVRDELMARVVAPDHEPITPFTARVRELYDRAGVSSVIVAGSSGAFFRVADVVIQMDAYRALDVTERARAACAAYDAEHGIAPVAPPRALSVDQGGRALGISAGAAGDAGDARDDARDDADAARGGRGGRGGRGRGRRGGPARLKVRASGTDGLQVGDVSCDLRLVEQLVDPEQVEALAAIVRLCLERDLLDRCPVTDAVALVREEVERGGLGAVQGGSRVTCGLALPRPQEVAACLNRLRVSAAHGRR